MVQNVFHNIIREIRRDRSQILYPLHITEESSNNSSNTKFRPSILTSSAPSKRSKSPKPLETASSAPTQNNSPTNSTGRSFISNSPIISSSSTPLTSNSVLYNNNSSINNNNSSVHNFLQPNGLNGKEPVNKKNSSKFPFFNKILNKSWVYVMQANQLPSVQFLWSETGLKRLYTLADRLSDTKCNLQKRWIWLIGVVNQVIHSSTRISYIFSTNSMI
jgi:hypothetical protein